MPSTIIPALQLRIATGSSANDVFERISTDAGRESFWVESSIETGGKIHLRFPNGQTLDCKVLARKLDRRFSLTYFDDTQVDFNIIENADGSVVEMTESGLSTESWSENRAGWISVLLNLKSVLANGPDLRNHDPARTWDEGFVDN